MRTTVLSLLLPSCASLAGTVNRAGYHEVAPAFEPTRRRLDEPNPYTCPEGVQTAKEDWKVRPPPHAPQRAASHLARAAAAATRSHLAPFAVAGVWHQPRRLAGPGAVDHAEPLLPVPRLRSQ
eukprot:2214536-Prymnesium_polylepis.1